jgi:hypothetical protein
MVTHWLDRLMKHGALSCGISVSRLPNRAPCLEVVWPVQVAPLIRTLRFSQFRRFFSVWHKFLPHIF